MDIYLVGGAVRDRLLGRRVRERDWVVVGADEQQMLEQGFRRKDPAFPVFVHPRSGDEYALARRERKRGAGHKGFSLEFGPDVTLDEDLARRDLTVNAIAEDASGALVDPFDGRRDLHERTLRHVTDAFTEDPLRVLRLARFHAELARYGFVVDGRTTTLASRMSRDPDLATLSVGRVWRETRRALESDAPAAYFRTLHHFGALMVLMPWLLAAGESTFTGALRALESVSSESADLAVRLAVLTSATRATPPRSWPLPAAARALAELCATPPPDDCTDAARLVTWLEQVDAWRRQPRFDAALTVWRAVEPASSADLALLHDAREAAATISRPAPGLDPRAEVRRQREDKVRAFLARRGIAGGGGGR